TITNAKMPLPNLCLFAMEALCSCRIGLIEFDCYSRSERYRKANSALRSEIKRNNYATIVNRKRLKITARQPERNPLGYRYRLEFVILHGKPHPDNVFVGAHFWENAQSRVDPYAQQLKRLAR